MKALVFLSILMPAMSWAQPTLPACPHTEVRHNCVGQDVASTGERYVGEYAEGQRHGLGTYIWPNGDVYIGEFKNNVFHGLGTKFSSRGVILQQGTWQRGQFARSTATAQGVDNSYQGDKQIDPPHGISALAACNPGQAKLHCYGLEFYGKEHGSYRGEFKREKYDGFGVYFLNNRLHFSGYYRNGLREGLGILFHSDGSIHQHGIWSSGQLVRAIAYPTPGAKTPFEPEIGRSPALITPAKTPPVTVETTSGTKPAQTQRVKAPVVGKQERRIALVMGNGAYKVHPLNNPVNDANDMAAALKKSGFQVIDARDATLNQMRAKVREFGDLLVNSDVGFVYYSGHGVEMKGKNYLIPVNADIQREDEIADQGLDANLILEKMNTAGKGVNILVIDACRDDPFGRSFRSSSRGLVQMDAPKGTLIAYSTSPGKVASDGDPRERNSPYTKHLLKAMQKPNMPIELVFKEVRRSVQAETKNQQTPWENTSLSGDFYFKTVSGN